MEDIVVTSAQVIFPDKETLEEKMSAAIKKLEALEEKVSQLENGETTES